MADNLYDSADDVKHKNDVKNSNLVSCIHERIAKHMKLECRDGLKKDRYKTAK